MSRFFHYKNSAPTAPPPTAAAPTAMVFSTQPAENTSRTIGYDAEFNELWNERAEGLITDGALVLPDGTHYLLQNPTDGTANILKKYNPDHQLIFQKVIEGNSFAGMEYDAGSKNILLQF